MSSSPSAIPPRAWIVVGPGDDAAIRIWGLSPAERLQRALRNSGCERVDRLAADGDLEAAESEHIVLVRGDLIFDARLIDGLVNAPDVVLFAEIDESDVAVPVAAHARGADAKGMLARLRAAPGATDALPDPLRRIECDELAPPYIASLRKFQPSYVIRPRAEDVEAVERRLFGAAYKTVTDLVTLWLWPRPAAALTRVLAKHRVHPNVITAVSWILTVAAALLFARGHFGAGLAAAWGMTFLDTVDGKLARVTLTSSRFGHVFDHALDLIHPPFWYWAWGYGASGGVDTATAIVICGYLAGRALEGVFLLVFDMETHCWRPLDNLFRTITARRNPNLILLTVGASGSAPALGMTMVAVWTVVSIGFHLVRILQALVERSRGIPIRAWDEQPPPKPRPIAEPASSSGTGVDR